MKDYLYFSHSLTLSKYIDRDRRIEKETEKEEKRDSKCR